MASIYGKDVQIMNDQLDYYSCFPPQDGRISNHRNEIQVIEEEAVECTPDMCTHPMALLRWFQMLMFFILQWLVQITCGNYTCTMIMNVFGYTAMGQLFVLLILLLMSIICALILVAFSLNGHRAFGSIVLAVERIYARLGIILFVIAGILGTWMAILTTDPEVNYQGRGYFHIRGQWIAASNYPFTGKKYKETVTLASSDQPDVFNRKPGTHMGTNQHYFTTQNMV
uniref:Tetraspanin n=1 Tax=Heterorhabditis bacteriophora TaxID=37862 RepID=A0A1I7XN89_HETBA